MSYFDFHGDLYCLDAMNGESIWQYWLMYGMYSSPAIADGRLYLATAGQFFAFDDAAPSNDPPTVTIDGPPWGCPGGRYNFTIIGEDPEESDLLFVLEWSAEYPGLYGGIASSGEPIVISFPFEEEGEYWIRVRVQDIHRAWCDWEQVTIKICDVELQPSFLVGLIEEKRPVDNYTYLYAKLVVALQFQPFNFSVVSSEKDIVVSNDYHGFLGSRFIFGKFEAGFISLG